MDISMKNIKNLLYDELEQEILAIGEKKFRAQQIFSWMHERCVGSFDEMTNLSIELRQKLKNEYTFTKLEIVDELISKEDGTTKYLFKLFDNNVIESVFMKYKHGNTICISTQVGCRMGCRFCASTLDGMVRNLEPSEMLDQIYRIKERKQERISNIVLMGSGEPLDNYDNVIRFIKLISSSQGLNISVRNITLSTCGLVDKIEQLANEDLPVTLALSLHASNNDKRKELMPIANKYEIHDVINACKLYFTKTGRRITFEYSLVGNVNDSVKEAYELAMNIRGINCHVNLIPVNPIKEREYISTTAKQANAFKNNLEKYGINVTIRREMGRDIQGACGQLRKSYNQIHTKKKEGEA